MITQVNQQEEMEYSWQYRSLHHPLLPHYQLGNAPRQLQISCEQQRQSIYRSGEIPRVRFQQSSSSLEEKGFPCCRTATSSTLGGSKSSEVDSAGSRAHKRMDPSEDQVFNSLLLEEPEEKGMKNSLIDELAVLVREEPVRSISETCNAKVDLFECIEEQSIHDEESYEDHLSEVVDLTPEEQECFSSFKLPPWPLEDQRTQQTHKRQISIDLGPEKERPASDQPDNKKKVIRNFFKPRKQQKGSADWPVSGQVSDFQR